MTLRQIRFISAIIVSLVLILYLFIGCETDKDSTLTTSLFNREPGALLEISVDPDSINVITCYKGEIGELTNFFAGSAENVKAFSVFKFSRPGQTVIDNLDSASVTITVRKVWGDDDPVYSLCSAGTDWEETERLDPAFLDTFNDPIQTITDTTTSISSLVFDIPKDIIESWEDTGAFLLKGEDGNENMAYLASDNSTSAPNLKIYTHSGTSEIDSTVIQSDEGTYCIITGVSDAALLVANGDVSGYVLSIGLPAFDTKPTPINQCSLTFTLGDNLFVDDDMTVMIYKLSAEFTTIEDVEIDLTGPVSIPLTADSTSYEIDISSFVNAWLNLDEPNYGILVKPLNTGTAPDFAVLTPADSLSIMYTTMPEVR